MINWIWFPTSDEPPALARQIVEVFEGAEQEFALRDHELVSNVALGILRPGPEAIGFTVETGKTASQKLRVPVLFGRNGKVAKAFEADAWHRPGRMVLEVEAGRGYANNQFLKDLFQASMMHDIDFCAIAVRNQYINSHDFENVVTFLQTMYASQRLQLSLSGVLIIGYGPEVA